MDEKWADGGGGWVGEGRELARATSRHELGCEREGGEGWETRKEKKDKDSDGECRNRGSKRNGEGGMPKSNGLIQCLSSMESRACQIACIQQPFSLCDGGIVGKGSSALTLNRAFVQGSLCLYIWPSLQIELTLHEASIQFSLTWSHPSPSHCSCFYPPPIDKRWLLSRSTSLVGLFTLKNIFWFILIKSRKESKYLDKWMKRPGWGRAHIIHTNK